MILKRRPRKGPSPHLGGSSRKRHSPTGFNRTLREGIYTVGCVKAGLNAPLSELGIETGRSLLVYILILFCFTFSVIEILKNAFYCDPKLRGNDV